MDVKVRVWAEIGRTRMPLADAVALPEGVLVDLDREHHEPIDLYVNGLHYGRGRLVMVEGEWALTIDEITRRAGATPSNACPAAAAKDPARRPTNRNVETPSISTSAWSGSAPCASVPRTRPARIWPRRWPCACAARAC